MRPTRVRDDAFDVSMLCNSLTVTGMTAERRFVSALTDASLFALKERQ